MQIQDTTLAAYMELRPFIPNIERRVLDYFSENECKGTCLDVEKGLGMSHQTASSAIRRLTLAGALEDSNYRKRQAGKSGQERSRIVWQMTGKYEKGKPARRFNKSEFVKMLRHVTEDGPLYCYARCMEELKELED